MCQVVLHQERITGMNDETQKVSDTLERATRQLDISEQLITLLMVDLDLNELKMSERLNFALKLMAQHARTLKLREDISREYDSSAGEQDFMTELSRKLRGDPSDQDFDDPFSSRRIADAFTFRHADLCSQCQDAPSRDLPDR